MYDWIIQEIIQKEKEKEKIEKEKESIDNAVLYIEPPIDWYDEEKEENEPGRGVTVIDIA